MEDPFVELAKNCARTCHVLNTVTEDSDVDSLSDLSDKRIDDLGRCVNPTQSSLPTITSVSESYTTSSLLSGNV